MQVPPGAGPAGTVNGLEPPAVKLNGVPTVIPVPATLQTLRRPVGGTTPSHANFRVIKINSPGFQSMFPLGGPKGTVTWCGPKVAPVETKGAEVLLVVTVMPVMNGVPVQPAGVAG
jgi:hypothetical protein